MQDPPLIPPSALILVAVINNPRDLEIARLLGWYRIPLRTAPRVIAVDYLAFYQTAAFGAAKWRVEYLAAVQGHELTTRLELFHDEPNHPHARQEYYKVQLGPLIRLARPILAEQWRRVTFFYTTGELLLGAGSLHDLVIPAERRQDLWQALRERLNAADGYAAQEPPDFEIDPGLLAALLGIKELEAGYAAQPDPPV
jgi:hypothetical protein